MIQTKFPVVFSQRNQKQTIVKIEVRPSTVLAQGQKYLVIDWDINNYDSDLEKIVPIAISSKEITYTDDQINQIEDYLEANHDFSGLTRVEKERKKLQLALMIDTTQTNLLPSGKTIYGLNPEDWEFSE